jgi:hypothetical protein
MIAFGVDPIPTWIVAPLGMRSATRSAICRSTSVTAGDCQFDQWIVGFGPADDLADVELIASEGARHLAVRFEKEPRPSDERGDVVGTDTEAEVAVTIRRRRRGEHQRICRVLAKDGSHLAEVVGDQFDGAGSKAGSRHVRQEVRDVAQIVAELLVQIGAIVHRVHLVDPNAGPLLGVGLHGVHERDRFAVREGKDDVGVRADVLDDCVSGLG